ncbi:MAG: T9SS type A sorting domain-containing protein [Ignavibacteriales bacterium]|nr:T9SS type A sorting domain-containing protein [Ignavibacteriales bacterium]
MVDSASVVPGINFTLRPRAHTGFGRITGIVNNTSRQLVNGAFVFAIDNNNQVASFAITDKNGNYEISDIAAGSYTLISEAFNYQEKRTVDVVVDYLSNAAQTISLTLTPEPEGTTAVEHAAVVDGFALQQNYPNPFNPSTTINFSLAEKAHVTLSVYDMVGREVAVLVNGDKPAGNHSVNFSAGNLASGVYLYKIQTAQFTATKKLVLMK